MARNSSGRTHSHRDRVAKHRREVRRAAKQVLKLVIGPRNQARLIELLEQAIADERHVPNWLYSIKASPNQDRQGVDAVAMSDVGPLFLQVKTSHVFAQAFEAERLRREERGLRNLNIGCVVVNDGLSDSEVQRSALAVLREVRDQVARHGVFAPRAQARS